MDKTKNNSHNLGEIIRQHRITVPLTLAEQKILKEGTEIRLTPMEFNLVQYLLTKEGQFIKSREILGSVWGAEYTDDVDLLRTCIWQVRRKLEPTPSQPRYIINRPGFGYRFNKSIPSTR